MQRVEAAQLKAYGERGAVLDQILIDLDNSERWPIFSDCLPSRLTGGEGHSATGLDETDTTDEPAVGAIHCPPDEVAPRLSDVALDQRARVNVEVQRSASRSDNTSAEALRRDFTRRGARFGRAREGTVTRPSATSSRIRSSSAAAPAGTISATALPRTVTRTC